MERAEAKSDQRQRLDDALRGVFLTYGYEGASLARLAAACGLGKASLYHHYPGGKAEMARSLLRDAIASVQQEVFKPLRRTSAPEQALRESIDGFSRYLAGGKDHCLIALLCSEHAPMIDRQQIAAHYQEWIRLLAVHFEALGEKPKAAERSARALIASLYGALTLASVLDEPRAFRRTVKRLRARFKTNTG